MQSTWLDVPFTKSTGVMRVQLHYSFRRWALVLGLGALPIMACGPRKQANSADNVVAANTMTNTAPTITATAVGPVATAPTMPTAQPTVVPTAQPTAQPTAVPTAQPTVAPTAAPTMPAAWPSALPQIPGISPDFLTKVAGGLGLPIPTGNPGAKPAGNPLDNMLAQNAARVAPGFTAATPVGRANLKVGEHAGMNVEMKQGKCYVLLAVGNQGVTQLGLHMLFPATPPNAVLASDTSHGNQPVIGEGKPLCPPVNSNVRVDTVIMAGQGEVAVQVWHK